MRKLALAAAFLAGFGLAAPAFAQEPEKWIVVGMQGGAMGWDASTIDEDEVMGGTYVSRLVYFADDRQWDGHTYNYERQDIGFKCKERKFQIASILFMEDDGFVFGSGVPEEDIWETIEAATPEEVLWAAVCENATILHTHDFKDFEAAFTAAKTLALPR
ncbi:MAG: hypothetical protein EON93_21305 [Burkholderiales bacterium]|nr:MAG: hypothetical protein EON93_21305 [Burkholderiales bacterium]